MFGRNTWVVFMYELRQTLKKRGFLFSLFGIPLIGLAIFFFILQTTGGGSPSDVLNDVDIDLQGVQVAGYVDETGLFSTPGEFAETVTRSYPTVEAARDALDAGEIDVYFIIPADYLETGEIDFYAPTFSFALITSGPMRQLFYSQLLEDGLSIEALARLATPMGVDVSRIERVDAEVGNEQAAQTREDRIRVVNLMVALLILTLFSTNGYLMQSVIEEKSSKLIEILLAYVRPTQLLVGKVFALCLLGLLVVAVYSMALLIAINLADGSGTFLDGIRFTPDLMAVAAIYYLLGYLFYSAIFGAIGAVSTSLTEGSSVLSVFIIIVILPFIFLGQLTEAPHGGMAVFFSMFPLTSPIGMVIRTAMGGVPFVEYILSISLLAGSTLGMLWIAGRLFRFQNMLSGRMPRLRELPGLIFGTE